MGAADAVPGVSGGTIAFISGIYEELINTIKQFGPGAIGAWHRGGWRALSNHLNLAFLVPLLAGAAGAAAGQRGAGSDGGRLHCHQRHAPARGIRQFSIADNGALRHHHGSNSQL